MIRPLFTKGVFPVDPQLQVTAGAGMSVVLSEGFAFIDGVSYYNDGDLTIAVSAADGVLYRKDAIMIRVNEAGRIANATLIEGTPAESAVAPGITWDADYKDICLAIINVDAGITTIVDTHITDTRLEPDLCGVAAPYLVPDTSGWLATWEAEFLAWFATAQSVISEDAAGQLLNLITAITADSLGALAYGNAKILTASELAQLRINAEIHVPTYGYGGREIPFTWAEIQTKVQAGDFSGIRVGDYKDIIINGTFYDYAASASKTLTNETVRMEVAGIDTYIGFGDTEIGHHIDFISKDCVPIYLMYNPTATNSGSFIGSALFSTLNHASNGLITILPSDVAAVLIQKRANTETKTGTSPSGSAWNDIGKIWVPMEREVFGQNLWSETSYGGETPMRYPIFDGSMRHIVKKAGSAGSRVRWWLASTASGNSSAFCAIIENGIASVNTATSPILQVPLCFRVA
jgi:hypothetical protein